jgi:long-chain acyl-CoA synthetase
MIKNRPYPLYDSLKDISDLKELVTRQASEIPEKTAFVYPCATGEMKKSFQDLADDVSAIGTFMYDKKMKDKHIAIIGENSYEWLVTYLAAVGGGNVAVGIDKGLPEEEIKELLKKADVDAVFVSQTYINRIPKKAGRKIYSFADFEDFLSEGRKLIAGGAIEYDNYGVEPDKTATILFTSGTSGSSKGVELTNRNIAAEINRTCQLFAPEGGVLAVLPFHHAFGLVVGVLMVLNYGFSIYINKSLKFVKKNMAEFKPQTMFLVPLFVEFFHKQIWAEVEKKGKVTAFKGLMKSTDLLLKTGVDVRRKTYASIHNVFGGNL